MTTPQPAAPAQQRPSYYFDGMLPDPPRIYDVAQHRQQISGESALGMHFVDRVVVIDGEYYVQQDFQVGEVVPERVVPDIVIGFDMDHDVLNRRNGWVISEMGKPPDMVFEIASPSTARRDYRTKPDVYARLGVPEYWLFDETNGLYYPAPLIGYRLVAGEYVIIPIRVAEDGVHSGRSEVLGLDVCWVEGKLRFFDPVKGEYLPDYIEERHLHLATEAERASAETRAALSQAEREVERHARQAAEAARASEAEARAEAEAARAAEAKARQAAEARAAEAEAELARLQQLLQSGGE